MNNKFRPIAINLPQFHPFPENDEWWGRGFTEWTNVTKAKPAFNGHYQPHLPSDLGFYDLRLEEARMAQASLAKEYGIFGFCYYYYWFNGKRLMEDPLNAILNSGKPDFPFMYCWANENWTKKWDGANDHVLIEQKYSFDDDVEHINFLLKNVFLDDRYIKVNGKPFFVVYRPSLFPNIKETVRIWREEALKVGVELYLGYMQGFQLKEEPTILGFDVAIDFQPDFYTRVPAEQPGLLRKAFSRMGMKKHISEIHRILSYKEYVQTIKTIPFPNYKWFPSVTPMWDNTARRKSGAFIFKENDPKLYREWLDFIVQNYDPPSSEENFIFINAWNEWAEGNHLEPCQRWGRQFLDETKNAFENGR